MDNNTPAAGNAEGFFFKLSADETGITELTFKKDAINLFATIFGAFDFINQSFDTPFPTLGDFFRSLAESADKIEEAQHAKSQGTPAEEVPSV